MLITYVCVLHTVYINYIFTYIYINLYNYWSFLSRSSCCSIPGTAELLCIRSEAGLGYQGQRGLGNWPKHPRWLNHLLPKVQLSFHLSFLLCALGSLFELLWKFFEKIFRSYEFIPVKGESTDSTFKTWELHHTSTTKDRDLDLVDIIGLSHRKKLGQTVRERKNTWLQDRNAIKCWRMLKICEDQLRSLDFGMLCECICSSSEIINQSITEHKVPTPTSNII